MKRQGHTSVPYGSGYEKVEEGMLYEYSKFKQVYVDAWKGGAKGCTTFRLSGKRYGVLTTVEEEKKDTAEIKPIQEEDKVEACFIDPQTGIRECA